MPCNYDVYAQSVYSWVWFRSIKEMLSDIIRLRIRFEMYCKYQETPSSNMQDTTAVPVKTVDLSRMSKATFLHGLTSSLLTYLFFEKNFTIDWHPTGF